MTRERILGFDLASNPDASAVAIITMRKGEPFVLDILDMPPPNLEQVTNLIDGMKSRMDEVMGVSFAMLTQSPPCQLFATQPVNYARDTQWDDLRRMMGLGPWREAPTTRRSKRRARGRAKAARRAAR